MAAKEQLTLPGKKTSIIAGMAALKLSGGCITAEITSGDKIDG
jgi:hypothetical protein